MVSLKNLETYQHAQEFRKVVSSIVKTFPKDEKFLLKSQLLRSSRSIAANIAEGYGRFHYQENIQFLRIARGSLFETIDHLSCALEEGYIDQSDFNDYNSKFEKMLKLINGYISFLKKKKETN